VLVYGAKEGRSVVPTLRRAKMLSSSIRDRICFMDLNELGEIINAEALDFVERSAKRCEVARPVADQK
jgi:hypothetical protein